MTQPPPPPANQPAPGYLRLHLQGNAMLSMITPSIAIDGYPVPVRYGENTIPVYPGQHVVAGQAQWMWTYGRAQHPFAVGPNEVAELWYAAPVLTFLDGRIGPQKQSIPGLVGLLTFFAAVLAVVFLSVFLLLLL